MFGGGFGIGFVVEFGLFVINFGFGVGCFWCCKFLRFGRCFGCSELFGKICYGFVE